MERDFRGFSKKEKNKVRDQSSGVTVIFLKDNGKMARNMENQR